MSTVTSDNPDFWQSRYRDNEIPWDLGQVSPPFAHLMQAKGASLPPGRMAVLGCGHGHDAAWFGEQGFTVTGFDYVPEAVAWAQSHYGEKASFVQADLFQIPEDSPYNGAFDYVLEHTCFCAIRPEQREAYVQVARRLLKPGGTLIGLFFAHQEPDGPPYKTDAEELRRLFSPFFNVVSLETTPDSIDSRKDKELLGLFVAQ